MAARLAKSGQSLKSPLPAIEVGEQPAPDSILSGSETQESSQKRLRMTIPNRLIDRASSISLNTEFTDRVCRPLRSEPRIGVAPDGANYRRLEYLFNAASRAFAVVGTATFPVTISRFL